MFSSLLSSVDKFRNYFSRPEKCVPVIKLEEQIHPVTEFLLNDILTKILAQHNQALYSDLRSTQFAWDEPELKRPVLRAAMYLLCQLDNLFECALLCCFTFLQIYEYAVQATRT